MLRFLRTALTALLLGAGSLGTVAGYYAYTLPDSFYVEEGTSLSIRTAVPIEPVAAENVMESLAHATLPASNSVSLRLFGMIPIKNVEVTAVDAPLLVPGGDPFGIKLLMDGVMVVGMGDVACTTNRCPAERAGIEVGDVILSVDGKTVRSNEELQSVIAAADGAPVRVKLRRGTCVLEVSLSGSYSEVEECYQAGMWVRDSTAGIGTVTFYEPESGRFAGLGHPVCDADTGEIIPLSSGEVVRVCINVVTRGTQGAAGALQGYFTSPDAIGTLYLNNRCGVFGTLSTPHSGIGAIPLGMKQEITEGAATIYTTIEGETPREFDIHIEKVDYKSDNTKNLILEITDPELLERTGGIVQGMSGSPILQNGKLIGAVTHVFVNDPTHGYGVFAESMYSYG